MEMLLHNLSVLGAESWTQYTLNLSPATPLWRGWGARACKTILHLLKSTRRHSLERMKKRNRSYSTAWFFVLFLWAVCGHLPGTAYANETLTNASAVLSLSAKQASSNLPVLVTGVVTAAETHW